jgi:hypothetical protein
MTVAQRKNLRLEGKLDRQVRLRFPKAPLRKRPMEPWKGTPKPAMPGNKPAMAASKPSTSSAKPAQSGCCAPTAKKPTTKK